MPIQTTDENTLKIARAAITYVDLYRKFRGAENEQEGTEYVPTDIDIEKSSLLARLLEGKDPLPLPPPRAYSYPWYELVEAGKAHFIPEHFTEWFPVNEAFLAIKQDARWRIIDRLGGGWVLTHPGAPGVWELRPFREDEERPNCGSRRDPILGDWLPIPADWVLIRQ